MVIDCSVLLFFFGGGMMENIVSTTRYQLCRNGSVPIYHYKPYKGKCLRLSSDYFERMDGLQ